MSARTAIRRGAPIAGLAALALLAGSCAYYNTFYLARRYYDQAALHQPYLVDRPTTVDNLNFNKSIDYSKKVIAQYTKSKWVDDAYLLWARALLGKDDPRQTVNMLLDFDTRYPNSPLKLEARFFLGVGYRQSLKYTEAERTLSEFLEKAPRNALAPYAALERARARVGLQDYAGAVASAGQVLEHWPHSKLAPQARLVRGNAALSAGDFERARGDFHALGDDARDDEERLGYLMREADCLEAAHDYARELALLKDAQSHEVEPVPPPEPTTTVSQGTQSAPVIQNVSDRYGRLMVRIGTVALLEGRVDDAVAAYRSVVHSYPHTPLAAEAQYRIGYAYETTADDFDKARDEYARVRDIANSAFAAQAGSRLANLDRLAKFKGTGKDSLGSSAEAAFLLAEQYLFQVSKPERALEEYRKIEQQFAGTPYAAKAITAEAWVLSRKLDRKAEADSLFWVVVREHPATEAQLAARDYLEMEGAQVPENLIQLPLHPLLAVADTLPALTPPPAGPLPLGATAAGADSIGPKRPPGALLPGATLLGQAPPPVAPGFASPGSPATPYAGPPPPPPQAGPYEGPPAPGNAPPAPYAGPPSPAPSGPPGPPATPGVQGAPNASAGPARDTTRAVRPDSSGAPRRP